MILILSAILSLVLFPAKSSSLHSSDYKIHSTEEFNIQDETYSGFMPFNMKGENDGRGNLFFWLAKRRTKPSQSLLGANSDEKLIIWLNGGPGCSSMVGMMWENGPFTLAEGTTGGYSFISNDYSWNEAANVLYVEQPVRTGFSVAAEHSRTIKTEKDVSEDFYDFLTSFLQVFPELGDAKVYITGESYAGAYIPSIAEYVVRKQLNINLESQKKAVTKLPYIHLEGVAIGNGVIDDAIQLASYTEYAYTHGLIPLAAKTLIDDKFSRCIENAASRVRTEDTEADCDVMSAVIAAAGSPNEYNTATFIGYDHIIKSDGVFNRFFNDPLVQEKLHVRGYNVPGINFTPESRRLDSASYSASRPPEYYAPKGWSVCNDGINTALRGKHPQSVVPALQFLINHIKVLLYSGEQDLNTNFLGTLHTLEAHVWNGQRWNAASRSLFRFNGDVAGEHFQLGLLSFMVVRNSGHLLPMDIPATALEMIHRFINDISFADTPLPSEKEYLDQLYQLGSSSDNLSSSSPPSSHGFVYYLTVIIFVSLLALLLVGVVFMKSFKYQDMFSATVVGFSSELKCSHSHSYQTIGESENISRNCDNTIA